MIAQTENNILWERRFDSFKYYTRNDGFIYADGQFSEMDVVREYKGSFSASKTVWEDDYRDFQFRLKETLKHQRHIRGLSHEKISERSGVARQTISKIEAGENNPTMLTMFRITKAMGMTLEEFIEEMERYEV